MTERLGVEVDYCPNCRGVWLDRGELDKLLERAAPPMTSAVLPPSASRPSRGDEHYDPRFPTYGYKKKSKKKHLLEELFDF